MTRCEPSSRPDAVFAALVLPGSLAEVVSEACAVALEPVRGTLSFPRPEGLHLTLFYAGALEPSAREAYRLALAEGLEGLPAPRLRLTRTGCFPRRGAPRVLWLAPAEEGARELGALAAAARQAARAAGVAAEALARSAGQPFRPHVTVARVRRGGLLGGVPDAFSKLSLDLRFEPTEAALLRSVRGEGPARYPALQRYPLAPASSA